MLVDKKYGKGTSKAAAKRKAKSDRDQAQVHSTHQPGAVIEMSGGRKYQVHADGSYRRLKEQAQ